MIKSFKFLVSSLRLKTQDLISCFPTLSTTPPKAACLLSTSILSIKFLLLGGFSLILLTGCGEDDDIVATPKPRGYFRIDMPEKTYQTYDSVCPFKFQYPSYAKVVNDKTRLAEPCWLNIEYPQFKATVHLSYKKVENNLAKYLEDAYLLASKQQAKASGIDQQSVLRDSSKVYGLVFSIEGNAASPLQFYLTDSTHHFLRGSLYFNIRPNKDSIQPVQEFISKDIYKMIEGFEWK